MSQESHYWHVFLIGFTKTHFLHPPNYGYWDVSCIVGKVWMRRLQRRWNRRKRFSNDGVIPRTSLSRWILPLEICMEVSRKLGQYWAPSYFPYISSSTHRILDKFGIYGKLSSRTIQRYLGRGDRTRTHGERGKLMELIIGHKRQ